MSRTVIFLVLLVAAASASLPRFICEQDTAGNIATAEHTEVLNYVMPQSEDHAVYAIPQRYDNGKLYFTTGVKVDVCHSPHIDVKVHTNLTIAEVSVARPPCDELDNGPSIRITIYYTPAIL